MSLKETSTKMSTMFNQKIKYLVPALFLGLLVLGGVSTVSAGVVATHTTDTTDDSYVQKLSVSDDGTDLIVSVYCGLSDGKTEVRLRYNNNWQDKYFKDSVDDFKDASIGNIEWRIPMKDFPFGEKGDKVKVQVYAHDPSTDPWNDDQEQCQYVIGTRGTVGTGYNSLLILGGISISTIVLVGVYTVFKKKGGRE